MPWTCLSKENMKLFMCILIIPMLPYTKVHTYSMRWQKNFQTILCQVSFPFPHLIIAIILKYLSILIALVAFVKEKAAEKVNTEQSESRASVQVAASDDKRSSPASTGYSMSESSKTCESSSFPKNKRESTLSDKESFQENVVMMTDEDIEEYATWILEKEERVYISPKGKER